MIDIAARGVGAIVTKTIAPDEAEVSRPCIAGKGSMIFNSEAWSEYRADIWIDQFLPKYRKESDVPVIASIGYDDDDLKYMVPRLEPLVDGYEYIPRYVGKDFDEVGRIVGVLRRLTDKPIWVKMNASIFNPVGFAAACKSHGADGIVAITSLGPNMVIDIDRRRPLIGTKDGFVWSSGPAIKPLALANVHIIKQAFPELSVIGCGGCCTSDDVIEFLLAGADAVQMLSEAMLHGREAYNKIVDGLPKALEAHGFFSVEDVIETGLSKPTSSLTPSFPVFDYGVCNGCGLCVKNCPYFALSMESEKPKVDRKKCFGCGLCESKCAKKAIKDVIK